MKCLKDELREIARSRGDKKVSDVIRRLGYSKTGYWQNMSSPSPSFVYSFCSAYGVPREQTARLMYLAERCRREKG